MKNHRASEPPITARGLLIGGILDPPQAAGNASELFILLYTPQRRFIPLWRCYVSLATCPSSLCILQTDELVRQIE